MHRRSEGRRPLLRLIGRLRAGTACPGYLTSTSAPRPSSRPARRAVPPQAGCAAAVTPDDGPDTITGREEAPRELPPKTGPLRHQSAAPGRGANPGPAGNSALSATVCSPTEATGEPQLRAAFPRKRVRRRGPVQSGPADPGDTMRISRYVYFDISSATVPAAVVTAQSGVEPDALRGAWSEAGGTAGSVTALLVGSVPGAGPGARRPDRKGARTHGVAAGLAP